MWRGDRKIRTGAVLKKLNVHLRDPGVIPRDTVEPMLSDLLQAIVSHVRDYRGNHKLVEVFASLLLVDGDHLRVVARDRTLRDDKKHQRRSPVRYSRGEMAATRAIDERRVVIVGDCRLEYPNLPTSKPYRSILIIPLESSDDSKVLGALCIDSSRPYFFDSFTPGLLGNNLENNLTPFTQTIVLILERLVSPDLGNMVRFFPVDHGEKEGGA